VQDAEALVLATEWPEFGEVDLSEVHQLMRMPVVFDGRNLIIGESQWLSIERRNC
jgi:UDPglucose 6-dehydrogenase